MSVAGKIIRRFAAENTKERDLSNLLTIASHHRGLELPAFEAKCVNETLPVHKARLRSYMKLLDVPIRLIINFHEVVSVDGIARLMRPGANL